MQGVSRIAGVLALAAVVLFSAHASAQSQTAVTPNQPVEATGVGISGGIFAGAEVVLILEAIIDVEPVWAWWLFPILGAAGGGVGGYFLEQASPPGAVAMLVTSMALLIPTAVAISVARAYDPESEGAVTDASSGEGGYSFELAPSGEAADDGTTTEVESRPDSVPEDAELPVDEPSPEPETAPVGDTSGLQARNGGPSSHLRSGSLFHVGRDMSAGFGVPAIDVRPTRISGEESLFGMPQGVEVHVPLLRIDLP